MALPGQLRRSGQCQQSELVRHKTLTAGTYHATITINAGGAGNQAIPLTLTVAAAPAPVIVPPVVTGPTVTVSKVVNAATSPRRRSSPARSAR